MTHGYGDAPGGWPPPSEPDPPARGRRRAPDPDEAPDVPAGRFGGPGRTFEAPPPPPVFDPPSREGGREPTVYGRHAVGRATPPGAIPPSPIGPPPPMPAGGPSGPPGRGGPGYPPGPSVPGQPTGPGIPPAQRGHRPAPDEGALTDRYVPRRGGVYSGGGRTYGSASPPAPSGPPGLSGPGADQFGGFPPAQPDAADRLGQHGQPDRAGWTGQSSRPEPSGKTGLADPFAPPRQYAPERPAPERPVGAPRRAPQPGPDRRLPASLWKSIVGGVTVFAVLVVVGVGAFTLLNRGSAGAHASTPPKHDISSQVTDPAPLTEAEVFPGPTVGATATDPGYQVVKAEASTDCKVVAVGDLPATFATDGCSQVVRATLTSADKAFVVTIGLLNLRDQASAKSAEDAVKVSVAAGKGRFNGLAAGATTDVIGKVATQLGWDSQGHFLAYAVLAHSDGTAIAANDPTAAKVINTLVEDYLRGKVLQARIDAVPGSGSHAPSGAPGSGKPATTTSKK